jgi:hypothetical protein
MLLTFRWREPPAWVWDLFVMPWACENGMVRRGWDSDGAKAVWVTVTAGYHFSVSVAPDFRRALAAACPHDWLYEYSGDIARAEGATARTVMHAADHWFLAQMRGSGFRLARTYFLGVRIFGYWFHQLCGGKKNA